MAWMLDGMAFVSEVEDHLTISEALKFASANCATVYDNELKFYAQAMSSPPEEAEKWHQAAFDELTALIDHGVFELVQQLLDCKPLSSQWVFKIKQNANGSIEHYKA
ncbi:hypothetical protein GYMLUDRAFT_250641 [Collybiopsis luxurians FD-317 M1]|uniref:Uncharacterized protein n=1 Tax=Collybiopsis luxurians FD-317 M1 TaxID=944289 RepID=A0A0D0AS31_9AGAR|nr:hypothetical protein GYMLUDRAFT_250641 [Collybiopsis luxurians FD-317 M1]